MKPIKLFCLLLVLVFTAACLGKETEKISELTKSLHKAATDGDIDIVKLLVAKGANTNAKNLYGQTPLHCAVVRGHKNIIKLLLAKGADINCRDNAGRTPLHYASGAGSYYGIGGDQMDIVQLLLDKGTDINVTDNQDWTPLHCATYAFRKATVELLVNSGADLNAEDRRGRTAFSLARGVPALYKGLSSERRVTQLSSEIAHLLHRDGSVYHVAICGRDSYEGTLQRPFRTLSNAINVSEPGDTIFIHGGTYDCLDTIHIDRSGEAGKPIRLRAYSTERPVFDFSMAKYDGFVITGAYWHIKGLSITNAAYFGVRLETKRAHHNILEQITALSNDFVGLALLNGAESNLILNCDSHRNFDPQDNGESADGLCAARSIGEGNIFIGCRAWENADDGFDFWYAGSGVRVENCYAYRNGQNIWKHPRFTGNANGFKLGQMGGSHVVIRCAAWEHPMKGFDLNGNSTGVTLHSCTAMRNRINYAFRFSRGNIEKNTMRNNLSFKGEVDLDPKVDDQFNSWNNPPGCQLIYDDFLSLDETIITGPRNPDGSIPDSDFLRLAPGSDAIDAGTDVGVPFVGRAPDLGAFEYRPLGDKQSGIRWLHQVSRDHDIEKIQSLLSEGANVNEKDWLGYTALHWAIYFGYIDVAKVLLSEGANPNIQSDTGRTPLQIATEMRYEKLVELLRMQGAKQ